jgi:threonine/homoserine/homoserine lactone efflux protein
MLVGGSALMWIAYYQADGEMRHEVAKTKMKHTAEYALEKFVQRMTNPEAQLFWVYVEEDKCTE